MQGQELITTENLVKSGLWTHFDPRLMEIWIAHVAKNWSRINPVIGNSQIQNSIEPATFGPLLETVFILINKNEKKIFKNWMKTLLTNIKPLKTYKLFFIGLDRLGSKNIEKDMLFSLGIYKKWGYYCREIAINKTKIPWQKLLKKQERMRILDFLIENKQRIRIRDYLQAMENGISVRQAERDLNNHERLRAQGNTKARIYVT